MEFKLLNYANSIVPNAEDNDHKIIFGKCAKKLRLLLGASVQDIADCSGVTLNLVTKFENGSISNESFYYNVRNLVQFFRECVERYFDKNDDVFEWLYCVELFLPLEILNRREKFELFLNTKFSAKFFTNS